MKQNTRRLLGLGFVVVALVGSGLLIQQPVVAATSDASTLSVGEVLRPSSDPAVSTLHSDNSGYQLSIFYNATTASTGGVGLEIDQIDPVVLAGLWTQSGTATPQAYATMQSNGNFVLYAKPGVPIWSTHTSGTGADNRLVMQDDGNLVMYTAGGHRVWASGTHAEVLSSGAKLLPGQHLSNVYSHTEPPTVLTMQTDGDLVLRFHGAVVWASNTTVPGSYLLMRPDGKLVIQNGSDILWSSRTGGLTSPDDGRPFLDVRPRGRFTVDFTPPSSTGGGLKTVFDSQDHPGEYGRLTSGDLRYLTTHSVLRAGRTLASSNGYRLTMQSNGNLVQRGPDGTVRWVSHTAGHPGAVLTIRSDGDVVVTSNGRVLWHTRTDVGSSAHRAINLVMQSNGSLVARGPTGLAVWSSHTSA